MNMSGLPVESDFINLLSSFSILLELKKQRIAAMRSELNTLPKGTVYQNSSRGKPYFVHVLGSSRRSLSRDEDLLYQLARKKYLQLKLRLWQQELPAAEESPAWRKSRAISQRLSKTLTQYAGAGLDILRITCTREQYLWAKGSYPTNPVKLPDRTYESYSGVILRSKSERDIANALELSGIPYRYESAIDLDVSWMSGVNGLSQGRFKRYYPDFVILTATGRYIIWEHLGRVDQEGYRAHNMEKISAYRQNGLADDECLILTFEKDFEKTETLPRLISRRILPLL